jgi:hypothetical protein
MSTNFADDELRSVVNDVVYWCLQSELPAHLVGSSSSTPGHGRWPLIRRDDLVQHVLPEHLRHPPSRVKAILQGARERLRTDFGLDLIMLPSLGPLDVLSYGYETAHRRKSAHLHHIHLQKEDGGAPLANSYVYALVHSSTSSLEDKPLFLDLERRRMKARRLLNDEEVRRREQAEGTWRAERIRRLGLLTATLALLCVRKGAMPAGELIAMMARRLNLSSNPASIASPAIRNNGDSGVDDEKETAYANDGADDHPTYEQLVQRTWRQQRYLRHTPVLNPDTQTADFLVSWGPRAVLEFDPVVLGSLLTNSARMGTTTSINSGINTTDGGKTDSLRQLFQAPQCYGNVAVQLHS